MTESKALHGRAKLFIERRGTDVRAVNISLGGMTVAGEVYIAKGSVIQVEFKLNIKALGTQVLRTSARVTHTVFSANSGGIVMGLTFDQLTKAHAAQIAKFVAER